MSHYAKVVDGKVTQVIVAEADFFNTFVDSSPGVWIQTSYNTFGNRHPEGRPLRGNYAGVGFVYDHVNDVFYAPQPYRQYSILPGAYMTVYPIGNQGGPGTSASATRVGRWS